MTFKTILNDRNRKEYVKSWTSIYQTGLMQLKNDKREGMDIGSLRPVSSYLIVLAFGMLLLHWGMQRMVSGLSVLEITFGTLVLFFIAINVAYAVRPKWFLYLGKKNIFPKGSVNIQAKETGLTFFEEAFPENIVSWKWEEVTKIVNFAYTIVLYRGEAKSYGKSGGQVLLINKEDLSPEDLEQFRSSYLEPLNIQNTFRAYYSYSDLIFFLLFCFIFAFSAFFFSPHS